MAEPDRDFARKLAELRRLFVEGFAPRLRDMEAAFAGLDRNEATEGGACVDRGPAGGGA